MSDYAYNPAYQELPTMNKYFTIMDVKLFVDLRAGKGYLNEIEKLNRKVSYLSESVTITLKNVAAKKNEIACNQILSYSLSTDSLLTAKNTEWRNKKSSNFRMMRVAKRPFLKNSRLILGNGKKP